MTMSGVEEQRNTKGPKAIGRVLELLLLLSRHREGLGLADISTAMTVPKSTFLDTLRGLCDLRYLVQEEGRYRLGPVAYRLASQVLSTWSAPDVVRQPVKMLARDTRESVGFAIADWEIGQAIYIEAINSTQAVRYAMNVGIRAPLYASAAGRVLLAYASPERLKAYLKRAKFKALTENTRTTEAAIIAHLDEIRQTGYCASFGEMLSDTAAIAVPVFGPDDDNIGAMMLAAPLDRMRTNFDVLLRLLVDAGHAASGRPVTPQPRLVPPRPES
jgi:IclR family acetate operon transcriptional repressor